MHSSIQTPPDAASRPVCRPAGCSAGASWLTKPMACASCTPACPGFWTTCGRRASWAAPLPTPTRRWGWRLIRASGAPTTRSRRWPAPACPPPARRYFLSATACFWSPSALTAPPPAVSAWCRCRSMTRSTSARKTTGPPLAAWKRAHCCGRRRRRICACWKPTAC